ncbi:UDP-N-acetylmuramoyl-tripeptide--D-alanyl-D-alanine ligase [Polaribacter dokdonensis]|uniref:UDP-N-acetylmuramoyl-tripeptide--D-alanyl-D-alanine ligase n=1 Tax=Polaribacter dokdonensis DSW-5 TaxID=1300348 RepID=A0A0M9CE69_9FLAO|nr:UDP-N-acetylmuramoyl-tripeptide--D-alanyl-D-alanine ligase [Polaribacter dokdonensis]KOY50643.1 UDP-N-acetylmuramoyl-tripeptide--D-alanyl-D-alanine ligase [Polaribacter dokdonensis DSW-5]SEE62139.1 UDP-N-acetylmuramoyl-tripeptide--D-alanyl-D-alanine ligase [Polaribacter dokdonensis DSW-5]
MEIEKLYALYAEHFLVDTDTRNIRKNTMFFALKGDNFNGNTYAEEALKLGANYAIVDEFVYQTKANIILVDNVLKTLQQLANYHRKQLKAKIIGLTGSNGKTTTKELIYAVLSQKYKTSATKGNLNNHIGVPLTLLSMPLETEMGIVEMGANHQKEIEFLSSICEPDYGYITNFGKAHLEGFGGIEGVIKGKSELYTFLEQNDKIAFINPEDTIQTQKTKNIKRIPFEESISFIESNPFVKIAYKNNAIQSNLIGSYNFTNIGIAITIGDYFKVDEEQIKNAIEQYESTNNRSQIIKQNSNLIILDAYNANPSSMEVALENFNSLKATKKIVILGDMFELGDDSLHEHQHIIKMTLNMNFDSCYFVGEHFYSTKSNAELFKTFDDFKLFLQRNKPISSSILIKGSRGMRLERILEIFK